MNRNCAEELQILRDGSRGDTERVTAAQRLSECDDPQALVGLLEACSDELLPAHVADAAGVAVATILLGQGSIDRARLVDFTGPAYLGFDRTVSEHQSA